MSTAIGIIPLPCPHCGKEAAYKVRKTGSYIINSLGCYNKECTNRHKIDYISGNPYAAYRAVEEWNRYCRSITVGPVSIPTLK